MLIIKNPTKKDCKDAVKVLKKGGIIVYPTETSYALGADVANSKAIKKIFDIKKRNLNKTLPTIAADLDMVNYCTAMNSQEKQLAKKHWPGPLTLVLSVKNKFFSKPVILNKKIAIRVPDNRIARLLSHYLGGPIVSTSANKADNQSCYSVISVKKSLGLSSAEKIDLALDVGYLIKRPPSTIVELKNNNINIIRQGKIKIKK